MLDKSSTNMEPHTIFDGVRRAMLAWQSYGSCQQRPQSYAPGRSSLSSFGKIWWL
jgi:hypothetical protein